MPLISPTYTISILSNLDQATVSSVANDLLQSSKESNARKISEALETIVKFSFASRKDPKATGKKLTTALFDLIQEHRYDFVTVTIGQLKAQISALTEEWIRSNQLRESLGKMPEIFNSCFEFCLYNYAEVERGERE
ncbi:MAG: hypothetical protein PHS48_02050 [Bacteroidales bacterium]|nr:hypothetical protein [Bacteroidales bacterium]